MTGARAGSQPRGRGRPAGGSDARDRILAAARQEFAAKGYDKVSLRGIARTAEVDPALLHHYFSGKEQVFVSAMQLPFDPADALPLILAGPIEELGERITRFFLGVWSEPEGRGAFLALLSSATTTPAGAALLREFASDALLSQVAARLGVPDAELRVEAALTQMLGLALGRFVIGLEPLASLPTDDVVRLIAPTVQHYLTGELP